MKNLIYLLAVISCTQIAASESLTVSDGESALKSEEKSEEKNAPYCYHIDHYEVVLTDDKGGMLKFKQLADLIEPKWVDMEIYELVHWGAKLLALLNQLPVKLTRAQVSQLYHLEGILQIRANQLQVAIFQHNHDKNSAERMSDECLKNSEKMQSLQATTEKEIRQFFVGRQKDQPEGIPADIYEDLEAVFNSLDGLHRVREVIYQQYLSGHTSFKEYAAGQEREKLAINRSLSAVTALLKDLQKIIEEQSKI